MRRLKHNPELVAWGEAYKNNEDQTEWVSESIYTILYPTSINVLDSCELPAGQYLLKIHRSMVDDGIYIGAREFRLVNEMINDGYYDSDGFYDPYNGEMVVSNVTYYGEGETQKIVSILYVDIQAPSEEEGTLTYKLWRIA